MYYINISAPATGVIDYPVQFSGESNVPNAEYVWDFDDLSPAGSGILVSHEYSSSGIYNVTVVASGIDIGSGTYIYDNFDGSGYNAWWNTDFTSTHTLSEYPPGSGNYVAVRGTSDQRWLLPSGSSICGDFDLQWQVVFGANNSGNISVHLALFNASATSGICDLEWNNGIAFSWPLGSLKDSASSSYSQYGYLWLRYVRVGSTITAYYDTGGGWTALANPVTYSGCVTVREDGAERHGIGELNFLAESGLPYSVGTVVMATGEFEILIRDTEINEISGLVEGEGYIYSDVTEDDIILGEVYGVGYIYSFPNFYDSISGSLYGIGYINGGMSFYFPPTPAPPTSSGVLKKGIKPLLTNKFRYPYKIPKEVIMSRVDFLKNGRLSYLSDLPVELWMNYSGEWAQVETSTTDRYGSCYITHSTSGIPNITNCLGVVKITYDGGDYVSNVMRYNFYSGLAYEEDLVYIIDAAATGSVPDRLAHDIFDGDGRDNYFDRMYYV